MHAEKQSLTAAAEEFDDLNSRTAAELGRALLHHDDIRQRIARIPLRTRLSELRCHHGSTAAALKAVKEAVEAAETELAFLGVEHERRKSTEAWLRNALHPHTNALARQVSDLEDRRRWQERLLERARTEREQSIKTLTEAGMSASRAKATAQPTRASIAAMEAEIKRLTAQVAEARQSMSSIAGLAAVAEREAA